MAARGAGADENTKEEPMRQRRPDPHSSYLTASLVRPNAPPPTPPPPALYGVPDADIRAMAHYLARLR